MFAEALDLCREDKIYSGMYYVYCIKSINSDFKYFGYTSNIEDRLEYHNRLHVRSTKRYAPYRIYAIKSFFTMLEARSYEKKIKKSHAAKEDFLINNLIK